MASAMTDRQQLIKLLAERSTKRGRFTLASGKSSDFYIDARITTMSPEGLVLIGPIVIKALKSAGWNVDAVGGLTLGADPIAYSISYASNFDPPSIRAFTVRKEAKGHGMGKLIEGTFQRGDRVAIVEDVITTGMSALRAIDVIEAAGGSVTGVLALVDRKEGGQNTIESQGYPVISITSIDEITALLSLSNENPGFADD